MASESRQYQDSIFNAEQTWSTYHPTADFRSVYVNTTWEARPLGPTTKNPRKALSSRIHMRSKPDPLTDRIDYGAVSLLGGCSEPDFTSYILWRNGHIVIVYTDPLPDIKSDTYLQILDGDKKYKFRLEQIQTLLNTVHFDGTTNWAYFREQDGNYKIVQRKKPIYKIRCPLWAPIINEGEIEIKKWTYADYRIGIWGGKEVDIYYGIQNSVLRDIDETMFAHRALRGLDVTYEVLAHLVRDDGNVIGLVTEPTLGRQADLCDRGLVYATLSKLQQRGFLYRGLRLGKVMVHEGKIRFTDLTRSCLRYYAPNRREELDRDAAISHWKETETYFCLLAKGDYSTLPWNPRTWNLRPKLIWVIPYPEKPFRSNFHSSVFRSFHKNVEEEKEKLNKLVSRKRPELKSRRPILAPSQSEDQDQDAVSTIFGVIDISEYSSCWNILMSSKEGTQSESPDGNPGYAWRKQLMGVQKETEK